jgi:hypothetical protein
MAPAGHSVGQGWLIHDATFEREVGWAAGIFRNYQMQSQLKRKPSFPFCVQFLPLKDI